MLHNHQQWNDIIRAGNVFVLLLDAMTVQNHKEGGGENEPLREGKGVNTLNPFTYLAL